MNTFYLIDHLHTPIQPDMRIQAFLWKDKQSKSCINKDLTKYPNSGLRFMLEICCLGKGKLSDLLRSLRYFPGNDKLHEKSNIRSLFRTKSNIYDEVFRTL